MPFLTDLYGTKKLAGWLLIWSIDARGGRKHSEWFDSAVSAHKYAQAVKGESDVYFGVGLAPSMREANQRAVNTSIIALPGFWLDVDYADAVHKKSASLPDVEAALELIRLMPLPYTRIIHSGHGFQAYWLFEQPIFCKETPNRHRMAALSELWNRKAIEISRSAGYAMDSTFDLARVMRVPGTINHRGDAPADVKEFASQERRYQIDDFKRALGLGKNWIGLAHVAATTFGRLGKKAEARSAAHGEMEPEKGERFTLNLTNPKLNPIKFEGLLESDPRARLTWEKKRIDLADQSSSGYAMSLTMHAVQAGWSEQETVDLIVLWCQKHGEKVRPRRDYYRRTFLTAYAGINEDQTKLGVALALATKHRRGVKTREKTHDQPGRPPRREPRSEQLETSATPPPVAAIEPEQPAVPSRDDDDGKEQVRQQCSDFLGVELVRIIKWRMENHMALSAKDDNRYEVHLKLKTEKRERVMTGDVDLIYSAAKFARAFFDCTGYSPPHFAEKKAKEGVHWTYFRDCLAILIVEKRASVHPRLFDMLAAYLEANYVRTQDRPVQAQMERIQTGRPGKLEKGIFLQVGPFCDYMNERGHRLDDRQVTIKLKQLFGAKAIESWRVVSSESNGHVQQITGCLLPLNFLETYYAKQARFTGDGGALVIESDDDYDAAEAIPSDE